MAMDYAEAVRLIKKGRRAEKRGKFVEGCITAILTSAVKGFLGGWFLMLAVGVIHEHWIHQLPTIGYWWAVLIYWLLPSFGGSSSSSKDD